MLPLFQVIILRIGRDGGGGQCVQAKAVSGRPSYATSLASFMSRHV